MAVEGFNQKAPPTGTQFIELLAHQVAQLIVEGEEIIPSEDEAEVQSEEAKEEGFESLVHEEDFELFYRPSMTEDIMTTFAPIIVSISTDQGATEVPEGMVIEKRLLDLLSLLESHYRDVTPEIPMVPRPPTPAPPLPPQTDPSDKIRKRDKKGGKGISKEGEIQEETPPKQTRGPKATQSQQRKGGEVTKTAPERHLRVTNWNPPMALDGAPLTSDSSTQDFDNRRAGYIANFVEQALLLPRDMTELCNLKKHEMFLSLKKDLALVCAHLIFLTLIYASAPFCYLLKGLIINPSCLFF